MYRLLRCVRVFMWASQARAHRIEIWCHGCSVSCVYWIAEGTNISDSQPVACDFLSNGCVAFYQTIGRGAACQQISLPFVLRIRRLKTLDLCPNSNPGASALGFWELGAAHCVICLLCLCIFTPPGRAARDKSSALFIVWIEKTQWSAVSAI